MCDVCVCMCVLLLLFVYMSCFVMSLCDSLAVAVFGASVYMRALHVPATLRRCRIRNETPNKLQNNRTIQLAIDFQFTFSSAGQPNERKPILLTLTLMRNFTLNSSSHTIAVELHRIILFHSITNDTARCCLLLHFSFHWDIKSHFNQRMHSFDCRRVCAHIAGNWNETDWQLVARRCIWIWLRLYNHAVQWYVRVVSTYARTTVTTTAAKTNNATEMFIFLYKMDILCIECMSAAIEIGHLETQKRYADIPYWPQQCVQWLCVCACMVYVCVFVSRRVMGETKSTWASVSWANQYGRGETGTRKAILYSRRCSTARERENLNTYNLNTYTLFDTPCMWAFCYEERTARQYTRRQWHSE